MLVLPVLVPLLLLPALDGAPMAILALLVPTARARPPIAILPLLPVLVELTVRAVDSLPMAILSLL